MHDFYQNLPCVSFSSSSDGLIIEVNETLCQFLGYKREELIGHKLENIFSLASRIFQQTHFFPLLQLKGHAEEIYITLKTKSKEDVAVLINAVRTEGDGKFLLHYAGIPINERKKYEDEIVAAKKSAEQALKENTELKEAKRVLQKQSEILDHQIALTKLQNQELKQINHLITHTLQEPLRKLMFFSNQESESEDHLGKKVHQQKIRIAVEDMYAKLKALQHYVWLIKEEIAFEEVDFLGVVNESKKQVESENPEIILQLESEKIPIIEANHDQMLILIREILFNAVQFRKSGNMVDVKILSSVVSLNKFRQLNKKFKYTQYLKLQIQDNGSGLDDKYQDQAFEFFRKLQPGPGQGIGLSLCKKIVENHGGTISLESQPNKGTCVILFLPLKQENC